jgi:hypothetical protein
VAGRVRSIENDIKNRVHDLPACSSIVHQLTMLLCIPTVEFEGKVLHAVILYIIKTGQNENHSLKHLFLTLQDTDSSCAQI